MHGNLNKKTLVMLGCAHERVLRERVLGVILEVQSGVYDILIISGGRGRDGLSEAEQALKHMQKVKPSILDKIEVVLESESCDTEDNFAKVRDICSDFDLSPETYTVMSSSSHLIRIQKILGKRYRCISVESRLRKRIKQAKTHRHHVLYYVYEYLRPVVKSVPGLKYFGEIGKKVTENI